MLDGIKGGSGSGGAAHTRPSAAEIFNKMDKDGNGGISLEELESSKPGGRGPDASKIMARFDSNQDGKIDESENEKALAKMREDFKKHCQPPPPPPGETDATGGSEKTDGGDTLKSLLDLLRKQIADLKAKGEAASSATELQTAVETASQYSAQGSGTCSVSSGLLNLKA